MSVGHSQAPYKAEKDTKARDRLLVYMARKRGSGPGTHRRSRAGSRPSDQQIPGPHSKQVA